MLTIEEILRARVQAGEELRVTIYPTQGGYMASLSTDYGKGWRCEVGATPDEALKKVLGIIPGVAGQLYEPPAAPSTSLDDLLV